MVEDNPNQFELEAMANFCSKFKKIYIAGSDKSQYFLSKYFKMAQIAVAGFILTNSSCECEFDHEVFTIEQSADFKNKRNIGIILIGDECFLNESESQLRICKFKHFFRVSSWNKRTIEYKMTPRSKKNFWIEVNLADHCNLNCQCCDHFSPIATETYLDFEQYVKDLNRLSELTNNEIGLIKLQGGEPLLNERLIDFIRVTREIFPNAFICLFTAGLLLEKWGNRSDGEMNIWEAVKKYEIEIRWTRYPINLRFEKIKDTVEKYGIEWWEDAPPFEKGARVWFFSEIGALEYKGEKHSVKHPFWLEGGVAPYRWISCYQFNESIVLRDGKVYTCPMIPYAHFFNERFEQNLIVGENDYIDIYSVDSYDEIAEFCTHRTDFCTYCAVHHRYSTNWKQSSHTIEEWTEDHPFYGDKLPQTLSKLYLIKIGFKSLKQDGFAKTWERTKNALRKK